jgi:hypothetical protein
MTLSRNDRLENLEYALRLMIERLGNRAMYAEFFDPKDPVFNEIYSTTWNELEQRGFVRAHKTSDSEFYEMRGLGWFCAMAVTGRIESPEFNERFGVLSAALKGLVDGRQQKQITTVEALVHQTGLPADWVYNVIKSNIWKHQHNRVGAEFDRFDVVWVPIDFNMEPLG